MSSAPLETTPPDRLWRYIAYYGMSEAAQRATRIATTVLVARLLTPIDLGMAATAITCFELLRSVANAGVGQAVIRAPEARLTATCMTAHRLMWLICAGLVMIQTAIGAAVATWSGRPQLLAMIAVLSGVYLMMPAALIQTYLVQRNEKHATVAKIATAQAVADNVLTILLAVAGCGAWAIVLPKVATTPIWLFGMRAAHPWSTTQARSPTAACNPVPAREILSFSLPLLGSELLTAARLQLDKVIVGATLGVEALGIYYFVFNAGIGLSLSLTGALSNALYPHFASVAASTTELLARLDAALLRKSLPIAAVIGVQAILAPIYVPILFGAKWSNAAGLVAILCASATTKAFSDTAAQALRAAGATRFEFFGMLVVTSLSLLALVSGLRSLPLAVTAFAVASAIAQLGFAATARQRLASRVEPNRSPAMGAAA